LNKKITRKSQPTPWKYESTPNMARGEKERKERIKVNVRHLEPVLGTT
jgi:hypothetical protein